MSKSPSSDDSRLSTYTIRNLDQLKILGDPLRMRILEAFVRTPGTTKQVAKTLGEPPTKLYHHVDALERTGLIELRSTRQNRGTLEKHYSAVADAFRVDPDLLPGQLDPGAALSLSTGFLQRAVDDFRRLEERIVANPELWDSEGSKALLTMLEMHADDEEIRELQERIEQFLGSLAEESKSRFSEDSVEEAVAVRDRYRLMIALYPLDESTDAASDDGSGE